MNPSTADRIAAMISTLQNVVLPALDGQEFAADQLRLVVRHLAVLREQEPFAAEFESIRFRNTADYARRIAAAMPARTAAAARLAEVVAQDAPATLVEIRRSTRELLDAIAPALTELWDMQPADAEVSALTREYEAEDALLGRVYFQGFGFEDGTEVVPSLPDFLAGSKGGIA